MNSRSIGLASRRSQAVAGEHAVGHRREHRARATLDEHPGGVDSVPAEIVKSSTISAVLPSTAPISSTTSAVSL